MVWQFPNALRPGGNSGEGIKPLLKVVAATGQESRSPEKVSELGDSLSLGIEVPLCHFALSDAIQRMNSFVFFLEVVVTLPATRLDVGKQTGGTRRAYA